MIIETMDAALPALQLFASRAETQLLRYFEPAPGLFVAESMKVIERALAAGYEPFSFLFEKGRYEEERDALASAWPQAPVYVVDNAVMRQITGYKLTGGALCAMRRKEPARSTCRKLLSKCSGRDADAETVPDRAEEILRGARRIAVLEDVENPTNVGAIIRSAAALSMDAVLLSDTCADPLFRRAIRVSMGTVFQVPWAFGGEGPDLVRRLRARGFRTLAMALQEDSVFLDQIRVSREEKTAVVLGAEGEGLRPETIAACDQTVKIPMGHGVDSLNVAAAAAVVFWALR